MDAATIARDQAAAVFMHADSELTASLYAAKAAKKRLEALSKHPERKEQAAVAELTLKRILTVFVQQRRKRDEAVRVLTQRRRAVVNIAQRIFDRSNSVIARIKTSPDAVRLVYSLQNGSVAHDLSWLPMVGPHERLAHESMLDELATRVRQLKLSVTMSLEIARTPPIKYQFAMLFTNVGGALRIYVKHQIEFPRDDTVSPCTTLDVFFRGVRVRSLIHDSAVDAASPCLDDMSGGTGQENDHKLIMSLYPSYNGDKHRRFLLFLLRGFPYHCMLSRKLAKTLDGPLRAHVPRIGVVGPPRLAHVIDLTTDAE